MPEVNEIEFPDFIMSATEMARSLKIGLGYLRKLEEQGLPYYQISKKKHVYDPMEVWKWYRQNIKHVGGSE